ncbi:TonB-dependent receptor [Mucilaginibacter sp. AW1-3]
MNFNSKGLLCAGPTLSKFILAMKLTIVLLFAFLFQVSAKSYSQSITLHEKNVPIKKILILIEQQSGYHFLYDKLDLPKNDKIDIQVTQVTVEEALNKCFKDQPIAYKIFEQTIVLKKNDSVKEIQVQKVQGTVTDDQDQPLPGVSVRIKGSQVAVMTDVNGKYAINVADDNTVLLFSFIGYNTETVTVNGQSTINVKMTAQPKDLSEVVVVGYGSVKKKDLTGSVSVVNVDNAKKTATYDVAKMLQGQVAGVTVQGSGEPGGYVQIKVRGIATFGNNSPLFVIDGVPVDAPFDFSPDDIESIQVLKDASSAAIYGSRAATGVVIITTKKGKAGPLNISLNSYYGYQNMPKRISLTDRAGYQKITSAAEVNAGLSIAPGNDPTNPKYISNVNTDWQKEMFQTGKIQDHNLSFSGGSNVVTYNVGLGYFNQTSTLSGPASYNRYTYNGTFQGKKGIFSFGGKTAYTQSHKDNLVVTNSHAVFGGGVTNMLTAIPTMPVYDPNRLGGYGGSDNVTQRAITLNVIGMNNLVKDYSNRNRMFGNVWGELEIVKNLRYKINLSYDRTDFKNWHYEPKFDLGFYYLNTQYYLSQGTGVGSTALAENTLTYNLEFGKSRLDLLVGTTYQEDHFESMTGTATDTNDLQFLTFGAIANPAAKGITSYQDASTLLSYLARLNYNFDTRYILTVNFRRDGSSRFSPQHRYGDFASIAGAWNIDKERFIHLPDLISSLKLRGGYGVLGNQNFGNYKYESYINSNASYVFGNTLAPGATAVAVADPSLKWETTKTTNVALDLGLIKDKLLFTAEYFNKVSSDIITDIPIPLSVGAVPATLTTNAASLKNSGIEFTLTYRQRSGDFQYDIIANANTLKNKVLQLGGTNNPIYGSGSKTEVGGEVGQLFGFVTDGIFQNAADIAKHATQTGAAPGDQKFKDINGDGVITDADRVYLGSAIPKLYYGLNVNASYKNFDASFFIQGNSGNMVNNGVYEALTGEQYSNHTTDVLNYWTPTNTNTDIPRPIIGDPNGNNRFSNRFVESGSYLKLQNAQIGYTFPKKVLDRTHAFNHIRIYLSGQNVFTISGYRGYDPDFISDGLFSRAFDYGSFPNPRTIMMGLQIGL